MLFQQIEKLNKELTASIQKLKENGVKLAEAERRYRIRLRQEILKLRDQGMAVTLINEIVKGDEEISKLRFDRDVAEATYKANGEHLNVTKLQIRLLGEQLKQEWNA